MTKPKLALLVNMVAPYRVRLFACLASEFDLLILNGGMEANRTSWKPADVEGARVHRVRGWQFSLPRRQRGREFDKRFFHIEPGYFSALVRERPQAVITAEMGFRTLAALAYGTVFRRPVWVWWGGTLRTERDIGRSKSLLRRIVARWAKRWISYGQTSTEYLRSLGIGSDRILQIQNCVDESWYSEAAEPALDIRPKPVLLHVGQMIARKGIAEFLGAAARLQEEGLQFSLVLVGSGPDRPHLQQLATALRLRHMHFYSAQPPHAMASFYRSADVLVFPTMEDVWGLVANEGVLTGIPVLCSKYAGCAPELFDPESIFDPTDEQEFIEALRWAVTGRLPRPDPSRLLRTEQVAEMIVNAVLASMRPAAVDSKPGKLSFRADEN
jgi:glycosyltransferase involved in cell wall biosynthesis